LDALFDCPIQQKAHLTWTGKLAFDRPWSIGLILGPSGSGKSTLLKTIFGLRPEFSWSASSVIDDFSSSLSMSEIAGACQAVGFNTIPAWMRPYKVLSNGEQFRVTLARHLLETPPESPIVLDEFTSVVDRQVAQIGSYAIQKYMRRSNPPRQFVAASCHYDILDWLNPDWVLEPASHDDLRLTWRPVSSTTDQDPKVALRAPNSPDLSAECLTKPGKFLRRIII